MRKIVGFVVGLAFLIPSFTARAGSSPSPVPMLATAAPATAPVANPPPLAAQPVAVRTPPAPNASPTGAAVAAIVVPSAIASAAPAPANVPNEMSRGEQAYYATHDGSDRDPMNWAVTAYKTRHQLVVYYKGMPFATYHAVFGRSHWGGPKAWEGDRRTPEGDYLIIAKHRSWRFRWFLKINYPNAIDAARFAELRADDELPPAAREGGEVGIHGTDVPILNSGNVDWTTGCISVANTDISELARLLPIGTLVVIKP